MRCPTCASEVYPGPTCSACGAALPREAGDDAPVLATTPASAGLRYQVVGGNAFAAGRSLLVQSSSWLASEPTVALDSEFAGFRGLLSGEALVVEFTGPGDVWLQTRNLRSLAGALFPLFPSQGKGGGWTRVLGD